MIVAPLIRSARFVISTRKLEELLDSIEGKDSAGTVQLSDTVSLGGGLGQV